MTPPPGLDEYETLLADAPSPDLFFFVSVNVARQLIAYTRHLERALAEARAWQREAAEGGGFW